MKRLSENQFVSLSCLFLFFDALNGFFLTVVGLDIKISIAYKLFFLCFALVFLAKKNKNYFFFSLFLIIYSLIWSVFQNIFGSGDYLLNDFSEILKLFYTFIIFFTFSSFQTSNPNVALIKISFFSTIVLLFNVTIGYLGVGNTSYDDYGFKGLFYAGNALSGVLVIIFSFYLFSNYSNGKYRFTSFFILMFIALMLGTKSAVLGLVLVFFLSYTKLSELKSFLVLMVILFLITFLVFSNFELITNSAVYTRISYFYDNGGITRVLLSGRDVFLDNIFPIYLSTHVGGLIFGLGFEELREGGKPLVEMDFFDILFIFGMSALLFYVISILTYVCVSVKKFAFINGVRVVFSALLVLSLIAFWAGHILFNGLVTPFLGILLSIPFWKYNYLKWSECDNE
ncbi:O-antigen ligase family protein [Vibrio diabolicus]|nr:O-antigen ligase family protein [Vibrio diabolicus]MCS0342431.1 O-antigen ligase family protein [Vibrio diabolicus]